MIGVTGKDRCRAIELFGEHGARQQMWPGGAAEGDHEVGGGASSLVMPIGGTDQKPCLTHAFIAPGTKLRR